MGYYVFEENRRIYVEDAVVKVVAPAPQANVLTDYNDESKVEAFINQGRGVKALAHASDCASMGRWGKYTPNCPKCEFLKKDKENVQ